MDMRRLRELHFAERFLYLNAKYNFDSIAPDQDYINAMCKGRIHYLDPVWDAMPNDSLPPLEHPAIIHYNLFEKPWAKDDVQYGEYFWHYARNSEYYAQIVEVKNSLTASDLEMAGARFSRMTERAVQISRSEGRFSDIFGSGAEHRL